MTAPLSFPSLPGLGFPRKRTPNFSTRVANHVSGRSVRQQLFYQSLHEWELTFDGIDSGSINRGLAANSLQTLLGFWLQMQGQTGTFLYTDPTDCAVTGQLIGAGDGATTSFSFQRTLNSFTEVVPWVSEIDAVYLNGTSQPEADWSGTWPNTLNFGTAPSTGAVITADFSYAFLCRFSSDSQEFEEFMSNWWDVSSVKFQMVKDEAPSGGAIPVGS